MCIRDRTYTPQMNVTPIDATLSYIVWESSKPDVVEIDEKGRFVAKAYGNAVITALADYGAVSYTHLDVYKRQCIYWILLH